MSRRMKAVYFFLLLTITGSGCTFRHKTFADRIVTPDWPDFAESVRNYSATIDLIEKDLPPLQDRATAEQVVTHQQALAKGIRAVRRGARQGQIFTRSVKNRFANVVRSETRGAAGKPARTAIREDNPNKL